MNKTRKGQAAMEYLMTYGWAILVLVIVIAALYYFLPKTQEVCLFQQGFQCNGQAQVYVNDQGYLMVAVELSNKLGQTAEDVQMICTDAGTGDITTAFFTSVDALAVEVSTVGAGASAEFVNVPCVNSEGERLSSNEGAGFKGSIAVQYSLSTDVNEDVKHITTGTVAGTVAGISS